jgi:hypothetical protein
LGCKNVTAKICEKPVSLRAISSQTLFLNLKKGRFRMKNLIEISRIVTKKKVRKIEIFDDAALKAKNSKFNEFYESLMSGKFRNDRDAATLLYACSPTDDKYRQLKSRFRKRLLNTLFFLDVNVPNTANYERAYYSCNKDWTLVKILLANGAEMTAADLAAGILATALKFRFADVIVNCSRILRAWASKSGDEKLFEEYDSYIKDFSSVLEAEIRSEELYQRVTMHYLDSPIKTRELKEKMDTYCDALVSLSEIYDSPVVMYNMYLVWTYKYEMTFDFQSMLEVCNRAEAYMDANPAYWQEEKLEIFQLKKMSAYLHLRDYKNGKIEAEKALQRFEEGSEMWFTFMELYLLLALHSDNYLNAYAIFQRAITQQRFKKLHVSEREKWHVYEVYIEYLLETMPADNVAAAAAAKRKGTFKSAKFMNDPVLYPKDQRIFTVHLVIAQILFFLEKNNESAVTERIDRLKNYANRQLKPEEYHRAIAFIRLLQQLVKSEFDVEELTTVDKYYNRLVETPFYYRGLLQELEIIPFEKLWNMILKRMK